jgi:hypothetical protein
LRHADKTYAKPKNESRRKKQKFPRLSTAAKQVSPEGALSGAKSQNENCCLVLAFGGKNNTLGY